jgi:hypothetical protein
VPRCTTVSPALSHYPGSRQPGHKGEPRRFVLATEPSKIGIVILASRSPRFRRAVGQEIPVGSNLMVQLPVRQGPRETLRGPVDFEPKQSYSWAPVWRWIIQLALIALGLFGTTGVVYAACIFC